MAGCASPGNPTAARAGGEPSRPAHAVPLADVDDTLVQAYAHYAQGMIYDLNDQPELAEQELSKAALADPSNADLVLELSRRYLQQKQLEKAQDLLVRATAVPGAAGTIFARLAVVYSSLGKDAPALDAAQTAVKRSPRAIDGYRILFFIHLEKGRHKTRSKSSNRPQKIRTAEFDIDLAELYVALEKQAPSEINAIGGGALTMLNRAARLNPDSPQLRPEIGRQLLRPRRRHQRHASVPRLGGCL